MLAVAGLAFAFVTGVAMVLAIAPRERGAALAGSGMLAGIAASAGVLFVLSVADIPWSRSVLLAGLVTSALICGAVAWRRRVPAPTETGAPADRVAVALDALTLLAFAAYAAYAFYRPLYEWDYFGIWGLKARTFLDAGGIDWQFLRRTLARGDYPLLVPLGFDAMAIFAGKWNDFAIALLHVALGGALLCVLRGLTAREAAPRVSAAVTLVAAFPSLNLWIGLAEPAVAAFGCAGVLFVRHALRGRNPGAMTVGALLLGLAAWSKNEGLALFVVTAFALFAATRSVREALRLWPGAVLALPWLLIRARFGLATDFLQGGVAHRVLERLEHPVLAAIAFAKSPPDQPFFWMVAMLTILVCIRAAWREERLLLVVVVLQGSLFVAQALATRWDFQAHVSLTMNRLPHQIAPLVAALAALLLLRAIQNRQDPAAGGR
jgi:hypothetical protein